MLAIDGQSWSSHILSVTTNRVLSKQYAMSINSLIKTEIGSDTQIVEKDRLLKKHDARSIIYI